jgi:hypothetical protein
MDAPRLATIAAVGGRYALDDNGETPTRSRSPTIQEGRLTFLMA